LSGIRLLATAKKLWWHTWNSSAASNTGKDYCWNIEQTVSSWGHGRRNYQLSEKCDIGGLKVQKLSLEMVFRSPNLPLLCWKQTQTPFQS
jgi:hypothetical protein